MPLFMISYDLIRGKDYQRVDAVLTKLGATRILASQWLLRISGNSQSVFDLVRRAFDNDDKLVVAEIAAKAQSLIYADSMPAITI